MTSSTERSFNFTSSPRLIIGVGFVILGAALLFGRLEIFDAEYVLRFWPLILIAIGLQQFFTPRTGPNGERIFPVAGVVWMAIGGLLLLNSLHVLRTNVWSLFWPIVLILLGFRLMTRSGAGRRSFRRERMNDEGGSIGHAGFATGGAAGDSLDSGGVVAILGGVHRVSGAVPFHGSEVTTFMGGAKIDLRRAVIEPGGEAVLDLFVVLGGCELFIPENWTVSAPLVAVMGGVEDKRLPGGTSVVQDATSARAGAPRLVIRGFVMLGGITIRS